MQALKNLFEQTITNVIKLKLGIDVYEYLFDYKRREYRNFESELDNDNSIRGTQVRLNTRLFDEWEAAKDNNSLVNDRMLISSIDITSELVDEPFRYKEMSLVYLFTILEDFGNSVVEIVNNQYYSEKITGEQKAWHSGVNPFAKSKGKNLADAFAKPFALTANDIDKKFVTLLYELKEKRNRIAHTLTYPGGNNYHNDLKSIIVLMCYLYHINDTTKSDIIIYPWDDYGE